MQSNSLLYQFSNNDSIHYLFGTIHIADSRVNTLIEKIKPYISSCTTFVSETNIDDLSSINLNSDSENNLPLSAYYSPTQLDKIVYFFEKKLKFPSNYIRSFSPFGLYNMIIMSELNNSEGDIMDFALWNFAKKSNIKLDNLESVNFQKEVYLQLDNKIYTKHLKDIVCNYSNFRNNLQKTLKYYFAMDTQKMYLNAAKTLKSQKKLLIYERNNMMLERILHLTKDESVFIAVGAAHLPGHKGILRLLKHKGYKVKPIILE
jgi:uncharacterized protein